MALCYNPTTFIRVRGVTRPQKDIKCLDVNAACVRTGTPTNFVIESWFYQVSWLLSGPLRNSEAITWPRSRDLTSLSISRSRTGLENLFLFVYRGRAEACRPWAGSSPLKGA